MYLLLMIYQDLTILEISKRNKEQGICYPHVHAHIHSCNPYFYYSINSCSGPLACNLANVPHPDRIFKRETNNPKWENAKPFPKLKLTKIFLFSPLIIDRKKKQIPSESEIPLLRINFMNLNPCDDDDDQPFFQFPQGRNKKKIPL